MAIGDDLTPKQLKFCQQKIIDLNATQASIRAGYSESTARSIGSENLSKPAIVTHLQYLMNKRAERTEITSERVLKELAKIAFFNMEDVIDDKGKTKDLKDWSRDELASVQEITEDLLGDEESSVLVKRKIKLSDKKASLELLGRHLKLFTDKVQHSGEVGITFDLDYGIKDKLDIPVYDQEDDLGD